jgi:hypothetical protein
LLVAVKGIGSLGDGSWKWVVRWVGVPGTLEVDVPGQ